MKRRTKLFLILTIVFTAVFLSAITVSAATYSGTCGENVTWSLDTETGTLTISGTGEMYGYDSWFDEYWRDDYGAPWAAYGSLIKKVVIENGVTSIGNCAFYKCTELASITIPDSVTSIGYGAFCYCDSLTSIIIPDSVTSIGDGAFDSCTKLTSITLPDGIKRIESWTFDYCTNLVSITIPDSVTSIGEYAFAYCESLTSITLPDGIKIIEDYTFDSCYNLASITIPDSVTSIGDLAFLSCYNLASITIPDSVTSIGEYAFYCCESLTSITLPDGIKRIESWTFDYCTKLTSITIPDSVTSIGEYAFYCCESLTEVTIPESIMTIGSNAFYDCTSLKTVNNYSVLPFVAGSTDYGYVAYYADVVKNYITGICGDDLTWSLDKDTGLLTFSGTGLMTNYSSSSSTPWYECHKLIKEVVIPSDVTSIYLYAFYDCTNLKTVHNYSDLYIEKGSTSNGYAGYYADTVNWYGKETGTCGENLTYEIDRLTGILTISGTGAMTNYSSSSSFVPWDSYRSFIKEVVIENGVTSIDSDAFEDCTSLTEVTIGRDVERVGNDVFYGCTNLKTVHNYSELPFVTSEYFYDYYDDFWESSEFPCLYADADTINWYVKEIIGSYGDNLTWTFETATGKYIVSGTGAITLEPSYLYSPLIKEVVIGSGVTSIECQYSLFGYCTSLTKVTIGSGVTSISDDAFYGCKTIATVINYSDLPIVAGHTNFGCVASYADTVDWYGKTTGSCGYDLIYELDGLTGILTISGTGEMTDYDYESPWLSYSPLVKEVVIENGVTSIGEWAFRACTRITLVTIPDSVTSIGDWAFRGCYNLASITIPDSVTSIGYEAFSGCTNLAEITIGSGVKDIGYYMGEQLSAFSGCTNLKTVHNYSDLYIEKGSTSNGYIGYYADAVNWYVEEITGYSWTFETATGKLTVGYMEDYYVDDDYGTSSVPWYSYRTIIKEVVLVDGLSYIGSYAFYECTGITEITIPDSVTGIGGYAFFGCTNLKTVNNYSELPIAAGSEIFEYAGYYADTVNWYTDEITGTCGDDLTWTFETATGKLTVSGIGYMLNYEDVYATDFWDCYYNNGVFLKTHWTLYRSLIKEVVIESGVKSIGRCAFIDCTSLTEITISDSVTSISFGAFSHCTNLKTVNNYSNMYIIAGSSEYGYVGYYADTVNWYGKATGSCGDNLKYEFDEKIGIFTVSGTGEMYGYDSWFDEYFGDDFRAPWVAYGSLIKKVVIENGVTSIGDWAFYECTGITEITISDSVTSINQGAFYGCINLKTVNNYSDLPIEAGSEEYGYVAYYVEVVNNLACGTCGENLTWSLDKDAGVFTISGTGTMTNYSWNYSTVNSPWFEYCKLIKEVIIEHGVTSIGDYAFYQCTNIKTVQNYSDLPIVKGSTSYGYIAYYADTVNWYGDLDGDCTLTNTDITLMLRLLGGWDIAYNTVVADVTGDGKFNNRDAIALIRKIYAA